MKAGMLARDHMQAGPDWEGKAGLLQAPPNRARQDVFRRIHRF